MNLRIYQAYYLPNQITSIDPNFVPYNNSQSQKHQYREYPIFLDIRERCINDNIDKWGYFSWKFKDKMPGLTSATIIKQIEDNPNNDVYFWNPFSNYAVTAFNVWEQGQFFHKDLLEIMEYIFPKIGIDKEYLYRPMLPEVIYFGLYCVGNKKFWDGFLNLAGRYHDCIDNLPDRIKDLHNGSAGYPNFPDLWYFPFIHERLLSTYLSLNYNDLSIYSYHHDYKKYGDIWQILYCIKKQAIQENNSELYRLYFNMRRQIGCEINYAENWNY